MALGPSEPRQQKALIGILTAAAGAFLMFQYVYTPRMTEVGTIASRVETLDMSNQRARILAARGGGNVEEQLALYERHVLRLEQLIPASEEVPALLRTITAEGRRLGVEIASLVPEPEVAGDFYTKQSYAVSAVGEFHDIGQFLTAIASLPRIITPIGLEMELFSDPMNVYPELDSPVVASFAIETYVLPSEGSALRSAEPQTEAGQ